MWPNLFAHNENNAYVMPHVTTCAVMSCVHHTMHGRRKAGHPIEITYGHAVHGSQMIFIKINCLTF